MIVGPLGKKYCMHQWMTTSLGNIANCALDKMPKGSFHEMRNCVCEEGSDLICVQRFALKLDAYCSAFQVCCVDICME